MACLHRMTGQRCSLSPPASLMLPLIPLSSILQARERRSASEDEVDLAKEAAPVALTGDHMLAPDPLSGMALLPAARTVT